MNAILIAGAALVGLPILLHLIMKQEPKRLTFPAYRFLKQKLKTNQRKLRLRHFILLALRMLLIALFCLTLYQPTFKSDRLNISGEQPVAVVLVLDTTPSMGYGAGDKSRFEEACARAIELLAELPEKSPVAIAYAGGQMSTWFPTLGKAQEHLRDRIAPIEKARKELAEAVQKGAPEVGQRRKYLDQVVRDATSGTQSVSTVIGSAYQLLAKVDQETEATDPLPKLVAVFTDRTVASWDPARTEDLKKLRETVPDPKPVHVVIDFGVDAPANVGILSADMKPQVIAANQAAGVTVTVGAVGGDRPLDVTVIAKLLGADKPESKVVAVPPGQTRALAFDFRGLKPGLHQIEFGLAAPDNLAADNARFLTFKVGAARRILTVTDDKDGAAFWQAAHMVKDEFSCLVVGPNDVEIGDRGAPVVRYAPDAAKPNAKVTEDLSAFEAVCFLSVNNPNAANPARPDDGALWNRLRPYLRAGGKLIVIPPADKSLAPGYNAAIADLMPGTLKTILRTDDLNPPPQSAPNWPAPRAGKAGVTWVLDEKALKQPLLKPVEDWRQQKANLDFLANPRTTKKFWDVEPDKAATTIVSYRDAEKEAERHPAILERPVFDKDNKPKGKVVLLTVRMDVMPSDDEWHDYWEQTDSTFFAAFPYLLVRYLAGDTADATFNYPTGSTVTVPLPRARLDRDGKVIFEGPGVAGTDAVVTPGEKQTEIRVGPPRTNLPGNFALSAEKERVVLWKDGFSTNVPPDECNLEKVPVEAIEDLVGKDHVIPIDRNTTLREWFVLAFVQPVDLFPWLLLAVLVLFVVEGLVANRFYRRPKG